MPKYIIERELPGAGDLGDDQVQGISQKSCQVLSELGPQIQWVESFVTDDKIYCVYIAIVAYCQFAATESECSSSTGSMRTCSTRLSSTEIIVSG